MYVQVYVYLRWSVERISVEHRLDHDESLSQVLSVELMSVIRTLIWTVVEHLQEWRAPQVEHELEKKQVRGQQQKIKVYVVKCPPRNTLSFQYLSRCYSVCNR